MDEEKKLRGAMIGFLTKKGYDIKELSVLGLFGLLRFVAMEHAKDQGTEVVVSYHFEEGLR